MFTDKKITAETSNRPQSGTTMSSIAKAGTSKVIKGYTDIQHFYKSSLKYTRPQEKEPNHAYELGYN